MASEARSARGICHVCEWEARKRGEHSEPVETLRWCGFCKHWIGSCCRYDLERIKAAKEAWTKGPVENCCGPLATIEELEAYG